MLLRLCSLAGVAVSVAGHGAMVHPGPPRNAVDGQLSPWTDGVPYPPPFGGFCPIWAPGADGNKGLSGANGQSCWWFSNGCSIGCDRCDGVTRGPIPVEGAHGCAGMRPLFPGDPAAEDNCARKMDVCGKGFKATNCNPGSRTYNRNASCGADDDWYYYSPWRAPGSAPVFDACGVAGGFPPPIPTPSRKDKSFGRAYRNTSLTKQGDLGSTSLKVAPTSTVWTAGDAVEVSWTIEANHGGGYQYRLCKADATGGLTETCFQKTPLAFVPPQMLRWDGPNGTVEKIEGVYVTEGTVPAGSTWAMNPVPDHGSDPTTGPHPGMSFPPKCRETATCMAMAGSIVSKMNNPCRCSGEWGPYNLEILDKVRIPADIGPGKYVLQWRWDCEESNQVWASCSDVEVVAAK